jgi:5-formyltetrahydrofolate cyclo-ligase
LTPAEELKAALRNEIRDRRRAISDARRDAASAAVCERLAPLLAGASVVAGFAPFDNEINPFDAYQQVLERGDTMLFPRVVGAGEMVFARVDTLADLSPGAFGIPEPTGPPVTLDDAGVILIPALAFDRRGFRLGFGGGFYDRILGPIAETREKIPKFVGVGYTWQLRSESLPTNRWDVPVDVVVTETETFRP